MSFSDFFYDGCGTKIDELLGNVCYLVKSALIHEGNGESALPINTVTYISAVVFFFSMGELSSTGMILDLRYRPVLLQVRAYALCGKKRSILYTFYALDILAIVVFIVEVTKISSTSEPHYIIYHGIDSNGRNETGLHL